MQATDGGVPIKRSGNPAAIEDFAKSPREFRRMSRGDGGVLDKGDRFAGTGDAQ